MISGIGTDLVSVKRIEAVIERLGDRFAQRILTDNELIVYMKRNRSVTYLATRFATKEAVSKALGTGIGKVSFHDIETFHLPTGGPAVRLHSYAKRLQTEKKINSIHLSLSDESEYVVAVVVLER